MHRYRQLHLWISDHDYTSLRELARARRETLSSVIRSFIKGRASLPTEPHATRLEVEAEPLELTKPVLDGH